MTLKNTLFVLVHVLQQAFPYLSAGPAVVPPLCESKLNPALHAHLSLSVRDPDRGHLPQDGASVLGQDASRVMFALVRFPVGCPFLTAGTVQATICSSIRSDLLIVALELLRWEVAGSRRSLGAGRLPLLLQPALLQLLLLNHRVLLRRDGLGTLVTR